jgi:phosphosulfolactate synthase (CoM biosynthesis protein A)
MAETAYVTHPDDPNERVRQVSATALERLAADGFMVCDEAGKPVGASDEKKSKADGRKDDLS